MAPEEKDVGQVGHPPHVRKGRPRLYHVYEADEAVGLEEARETDDRVDPGVDLDEVKRYQGHGVQYEVSRVDVVLRQLQRIVDDQPVLEVPGAQLNDDVEQVDEVTKNIGGQPKQLQTPP